MRTYKRKRENVRPLTQEILEEARTLMATGLSMRAAAEVLDFDESTLRKRLKAGFGVTKLGRKKVFTSAQEHELVEHCKELDLKFYGLTLRSLRFLCFKFAEDNNIPNSFNKESKLAGRDFTRGFMKRNRLSLRTPRKISIARVMGFNRAQLSTYFQNLTAALLKYEFPANRIYNMDETGIQTVPNKLPKHVAPLGKREVAKSVSAEQGQTVSVACCVSPTGHYIPPFFIFKRKRYNGLLINHGPTGCGMAVADKGYMNMETFIKWIDHFKKFTAPTEANPVLLILDNHTSHVSYQSVCYAKDNSIHMVSLPPHSSQKTQPLDRVIFRPLKAYYDTAVDNWIACHPGQTITVFHVAELFKIAYERIATLEKAAEAFRATGIHPLNEHIFCDADFIPSQVTDQFEDEPQDMNDDNRFVIDFHDNQESGTQEEPSEVMEQPEPQLGPVTSCDLLPNDPIIEQLEPQPGPSTISPRDIIPLPKIKIKRKRRGGMKSSFLTSTPIKNKLEEAHQEKAKILLAKAERKKKNLFGSKPLNSIKPPKVKKGKQKRSNKMINVSERSDTSCTVSSGESVLTDLSEGSENECYNPIWKKVGRYVDEHVIIKYDGKLYPGKIIEISENTATVKSMQQCGRLWKWPDRSDVLQYSWSSVISQINLPRKVSKTRNVFAVPELESLWN